MRYKRHTTAQLTGTVLTQDIEVKLNSFLIGFDFLK